MVCDGVCGSGRGEDDRARRSRRQRIDLGLREQLGAPIYVGSALTCSLKTDPVTMRVQRPQMGRREGLSMNKRHTPEQIVRKLRQAEAELAAGASVPEVSRRLAISEATFHRWRNHYGGMKADAMKRLKELEKENARLKKIVADQAVDIDILKEVSRGNF
jgi:putative transposase